ncbi:zinc finger protein family member, putative [Trypanosoma equiperdum]|uniref:Uncharacterized protein n=2 Tax=Trypanozoon TaxID=39700 RepID=Q389G8_TRYB2|nr:hypothetical protein, conserved [Trypanosoma brucei brucei TREU927]EAN78552.1 hypothetical protein, conserved [Trypanosoma brucei brucei TREU927]SCU70718.1 zinc finger protein family member, putative [Trypanosoma equiperdum]
MDSSLCFVCSRCEHPICSHVDIITKTVSNGTTEHAFVYEMEDLLNMDRPVPCYSGDEICETRVHVSEKILNVPLPPAARLVALEALANSQRARALEVVPSGPVTDADNSLTSEVGHVTTDSGQNPQGNHDEEADNVAGNSLGQISRIGGQGRSSPSSPTNGSGDVLTRSLARFSRTKETRVDLICVKEDVLSGGLARCTTDRSADTPPVPLTSSLVSDAPGTASVAAGGEESGGASASLMRGTQSTLGIVSQTPTATRWLRHPGNLIVEEGFVQVRRRTKTSRCPWFNTYNCSERLECPDCHLALGYLFVVKPTTQTHSHHAPAPGPEPTVMEDAEEGSPVGTHRLQQKRERNEDQEEVVLTVSEETTARENSSTQEQKQQCEGKGADEPFPTTFVGLELKKIRQRHWGLRDFQKRYHQAKDLKTFRLLFPEAEELESVYSRLVALRTQSELYGNLLRKHKEQNDVQYALIESQKERISSYEEKLNTMQQIIEAQRAQLDMQCKQIKHQEELLRNHKSQVATQQYQIHVEQLLRSEQSRTIESQREQLTLMQAHLRARVMKEQLEERYGQLISLLQHVDEQQQQQESPTSPSSTPTPSPSAPSQGTSCPILPPAHLVGVIGRDVREQSRVSSEYNRSEGSHGAQERYPSRGSTLPTLLVNRNVPHNEGEATVDNGPSNKFSAGRSVASGVSGGREKNHILYGCSTSAAEQAVGSARRAPRERAQLSPVQEASPNRSNASGNCPRGSVSDTSTSGEP